jgi:hypothetical protein
MPHARRRSCSREPSLWRGQRREGFGLTVTQAAPEALHAAYSGRLTANVADGPIEVVTAPARDPVAQVNVAASPRANWALEIWVAGFRIR